MRKLLLLLFCPALAWSDCTVSAALEVLRPGSQFTVRDNKYEGINWLDSKSTVPTLTQVNNEIAACNTTKVDEQSVKITATAIVNDATKTDRERIDALVKILGLDK